MELGNICFGNSRGSFPVPRGSNWEFHLDRLMFAINGEPSSYGTDFENDTFVMMPYWWGDCTCGFDDYEFKETHNDDCYRMMEDARKIARGWTRESKYWLDRPKALTYDQANKVERGIRKQLCKEHGIPWNNGLGCAIHCDCDYDERYKEWIKFISYPEGHKEDCKLVVPNFLYKPDEFELSWYKYYLRDSYMSHNITKEDFSKIVDACIASTED